jgi:hypothetical protein
MISGLSNTNVNTQVISPVSKVNANRNASLAKIASMRAAREGQAATTPVSATTPVVATAPVNRAAGGAGKTRKGMMK